MATFGSGWASRPISTQFLQVLSLTLLEKMPIFKLFSDTRIACISNIPYVFPHAATIQFHRSPFDFPYQ